MTDSPLRFEKALEWAFCCYEGKSRDRAILELMDFMRTGRGMPNLRALIEMAIQIQNPPPPEKSPQ